ncbi:heme exporter protein CcmD [Tranquillimonas rosea]|uniref:Heme exporter protein D n=1 Tax=Tranquillimonas rosea TaxID=641238 RepID=A0A1H9PXI3_9RHOB|nr:heme exporter protein CcmD [Tranquillimonas rosea]SER52545.1 heme exporter protein CcmD [Tranquillimonas rosea]
MSVELGRYAAEVLVAYAGSLVLLAGLVGLSVARARRVRRQLDEAEARRNG